MAFRCVGSPLDEMKRLEKLLERDPESAANLVANGKLLVDFVRDGNLRALQCAAEHLEERPVDEKTGYLRFMLLNSFDLQQSYMRDILHNIIENVDSPQSADAVQPLIRFLLDAGVDINWQRKSDLLIEAKFQVLDRTIKMLSKSKKLRTPRVASSDQLRELPKNWFAPSAVGITETAPKTKRKNRPRTAIGKHMKENQKSVEPPSPPRPEVEPTPRSVEVEVAPDWEGKSSPPVPNPVPNADDPSFYMLELRLVHPEPLMNWRFQASFTDTSVDPPKTVILDDLTADDENCLLFDDPRLAQGSTPSRYFNPFLYFPGLSRPSDLYGHALRIIVTSLQPVTRIVINTSVQFTRFPDEAVVKPPVQSIRQHSENVDNYLRVLPRRNRSASSASRRGVKVSKLGKKKTPRPPPQNTNHESSTSSLAMDQCNPWSSSEQNDIDADDHQDSMLKQVFTLQLDEPRPPSPTTPTRKSPTTENLGRSPRTPMATIDKKKMQLQRLRANIRGQVVELTEAEQAQHQLQMEQQLKSFWAKQLLEMEQLEVGSEQDFKNHNDLPLARIKRIMKSDEDVRMISAEAPVLFAKACEMFILELTLRSWGYSEKNKRRTLQKEDIQTAIRNTDIFDFLVDVIN
ncbi:Histone-fold [Phytophthora cactorum]|nr:Histone-fold [Phytophthora cactorum]